jgi:flagellar assembly factor FliW
LKIETTRFGQISIQTEKIIQMPHGIPGFPDQRQFIIFEHRHDSPFLWYQSVDEPALAFVITDPFLFKPEYDVDIPKILKDLSWDPEPQPDQVQLYVIVNIPKGNPEEMTANLMGPILLNQTTREAVQVVLTDGNYSHRVPLLAEKSN